jgi:hypothetical protein
MNNTYVSSFQIDLPRRAFIALIGGSALLIASCGNVRVEPEVSAEEAGIQAIIAEKSKFILAANSVAASYPIYASPLKIVIAHNELHIEALTKFAILTVPQSDASATPEGLLTLSRISAQCSAFSTKHLEFACSGVNPELSRTLGLIAGSEIMHHAFLNAIAA